MNEHTRTLLEFDRILATISDMCFSSSGRKRFDENVFFPDAESIRACQKKVLALANAGWSPSGAKVVDVGDISVLFDDERTEALELSDCFMLLSFLIMAKSLLTSIRDLSDLQLHTATFPDALYKRLNQCFNRDGLLLDSCMPEYATVQEKISRINKKIANIAHSYLVNYPGSFQNDQAVLRNDRTVLPIISSKRHLFRGIYHGSSDSGSTAFVEPEDILEENNKLVALKEELEYIIYRLRRELTSLCLDNVEHIRGLDEAIAELDCYYARAMYRKRYKAHFSETATDRQLSLQEVCHPLVHNCIPLSINMDAKDNFLLVTGPNAGGKTVLLKTIALAALMHQSAIPLHAAEGSTLPIFSQVHIQLGDEQSIDAAQSTFSAAMTHIAAILKQVDRDSLVIIDELGSGTDPEEGAALAICIVDALRQADCMTICSSHVSEIKAHAVQNGRCLSMTFDAKHARPEFRIREGVADSSHAFESAEQSGIPKAILTKARAHHSKHRSEYSSLLNDFSRNLAELHKEKERVEKEARALARERKEMAENYQKVEEEHKEKHREAVIKLDSFVKDSARNLEQLVRTLREGEITKTKTKQVHDFLADMRSRVVTETQETKEKTPQKLAKPEKLAPGIHVHFKKNKKHAVVEKILSDGSIELTLDNGMRMYCTSEQIAPDYLQTRVTKPSVSIDVGITSVPLSIDIRGCQIEEGIAQCEQAINKVLLSGSSRVTVIHGIGKGILREALHDHFVNYKPQVSLEKHSHGGSTDIIIST